MKAETRPLGSVFIIPVDTLPNSRVSATNLIEGTRSILLATDAGMVGAKVINFKFSVDV